MTGTPQIDITSPAFATRLADLLRTTRAARRERRAELARRSAGRFDRRDLLHYERGLRPIDEASLDELMQLYRCDLGPILPARLQVEVTPLAVSVGGVSQGYHGDGDDAVLDAYLGLVQVLRHRHHTPLLDLRRDDLEALAGYLHTSRESVLHRLATLMNATQRKRAAMAGVLASGAAVVGLVGSAAAVGGGDDGAPAPPADAVPTAVVEPMPADEQPIIVPAGPTTPTTVAAATATAMLPPTVAPSADSAESATDNATGTLLEINTPVATELVEVGDPPLPPEF
jgi:hypothetical protein